VDDYCADDRIIKMSNPGPVPRLQFSLQWLLVAVTLVALLFGWSAMIGDSPFRMLAAGLYVIVPTPLIMGAVYGRGDTRAFSIGAFLPWISRWADGVPTGMALIYILQSVTWLLLTGAVCGALAVTVRRWLIRRGQFSGPD
jgi:hypothetical protein